jgi:hypothetical protein
MYLLVYIYNTWYDCFEFIYLFLLYPKTTLPRGPWKSKFWAHFFVLGISFSLFLAPNTDSGATWRTTPLNLCRLETGWPSYTPRHWVSLLVTSYDTQGYGGVILLCPLTEILIYTYVWLKWLSIFLLSLSLSHTHTHLYTLFYCTCEHTFCDILM